MEYNELSNEEWDYLYMQQQGWILQQLRLVREARQKEYVLYGSICIKLQEKQVNPLWQKVGQ